MRLHWATHLIFLENGKSRIWSKSCNQRRGPRSGTLALNGYLPPAAAVTHRPCFYRTFAHASLCKSRFVEPIAEKLIANEPPPASN
jgi:hypothetical protein